MSSRGLKSGMVIGCAMILLMMSGCTPCARVFHMTALSYFPHCKSALRPPEPVPHFADPNFFGYHGTCWHEWPEGWINCPCDEVYEETGPGTLMEESPHEIPAPDKDADAMTPEPTPMETTEPTMSEPEPAETNQSPELEDPTPENPPANLPESNAEPSALDEPQESATPDNQDADPAVEQNDGPADEPKPETTDEPKSRTGRQPIRRVKPVKVGINSKRTRSAELKLDSQEFKADDELKVESRESKAPDSKAQSPKFESASFRTETETETEKDTEEILPPNLSEYGL